MGITHYICAMRVSRNGLNSTSTYSSIQTFKTFNIQEHSFKQENVYVVTKKRF